VPHTLRSVLTMVAVLPEPPLLEPAPATGASAGITLAGEPHATGQSA
jgi:hypothetical protein